MASSLRTMLWLMSGALVRSNEECFPHRPNSLLNKENCCNFGGQADCFGEEFTFERCCPGLVGQDPMSCFKGDLTMEEWCCAGGWREECFDGSYTGRSCCRTNWKWAKRSPALDQVFEARRAADAAGSPTAGGLFAHLLAREAPLRARRCVEVGVQRGTFSEHFLEALHGIGATPPSYFMVDVWQDQDNYDAEDNVGSEEQLGNLQATLQRVASFWPSVSLLQLASREAARLFDAESLDFVYLDGRRDYCAVSEELQLYWPLVKPGGILAGGNYKNLAPGERYAAGRWDLCQNGSRMEGGVHRALKEFVETLNLEPRPTNVADQFILQKPAHEDARPLPRPPPRSPRPAQLTLIPGV